MAITYLGIDESTHGGIDFVVYAGIYSSDPDDLKNGNGLKKWRPYSTNLPPGIVDAGANVTIDRMMGKRYRRFDSHMVVPKETGIGSLETLAVVLTEFVLNFPSVQEVYLDGRYSPRLEELYEWTMDRRHHNAPKLWTLSNGDRRKRILHHADAMANLYAQHYFPRNYDPDIIVPENYSEEMEADTMQPRDALPTLIEPNFHDYCRLFRCT